jgi:uncharacterized membrane protein
MEKIEGCDCKVKRTRLVWIVDWLCGALLIGITVWVACRYAAMPDKIPTHYGADGVIDGYGDKSMIWVLLSIAWFIVGLLSVTELFPKYWNIPFKVTKENQARVLTIAWHMLSATKLIVTGVFAYLAIKVTQGGNLSAYFAPIFISAISLNSLYWVVRLFLNRK